MICLMVAIPVFFLGFFYHQDFYNNQAWFLCTVLALVATDESGADILTVYIDLLQTFVLRTILCIPARQRFPSGIFYHSIDAAESIRSTRRKKKEKTMFSIKA